MTMTELPETQDQAESPVATAPETPAVEALTEILGTENAALHEGELDRVHALFPRKAELAEAVEAELAQPGLLDDPEVRARVAGLRQLVARNETLLASVAGAASDIVAEMERIRRRHGLSGLYDRDGERRDQEVTQAARMDRIY